MKKGITHTITILPQILYFTFLSTRPTTWIRIIAELLIGFTAGGGTGSADFQRLFLVFFSCGPCLWGAAYIVNDISDKKIDQAHASRKRRPIARGVLSAGRAWNAATVLIITAFVISVVLGGKFFAGLLILGLAQIFYTLPPFRFKEKAPFDLFTNAIAAGARYSLGFYAAGGDMWLPPIGFLIFAASLKLILFLGHRLQSRSLEISQGFSSSVTMLSPHQIRVMFAVLFVAAGFFYYQGMSALGVGGSMVIPPLGVLVLMAPLYSKVKNGYLSRMEETIRVRVYTYCVLLIFSLSVYLIAF